MLDLFCQTQLQGTLFDSFITKQTITQQQRPPVTFRFHLGLLAGVIYYFNIESVIDCEVLDTSANFLRASARVFFSFLFMPWLPDDTPLVRCKYLYFY
jgi:hypothetical protein